MLTRGHLRYLRNLRFFTFFSVYPIFDPMGVLLYQGGYE